MGGGEGVGGGGTILVLEIFYGLIYHPVAHTQIKYRVSARFVLQTTSFVITS